MKNLERLIFIICMLSSFQIYGQTSLAAGDLAIVGVWGYNDASYDDSFAFVLFKNINAGTTIYFTDKGWTEAGAFYQLSPLGETVVTYVAPSSISAGTILYYYASKPGSSPGFSYTNNNTFSTISDQWFAYQGSESSPIFLYGLQLGNINWISTPGTSQSTNNSWLPSSLTTGTSAIAFTAGQDNAVYSGGSNPNLTTLRTLIGNTANWTTGATTNRPAFPSSPLPVELTSFSAVLRSGTVYLQWQTATEVNNAGFAIERGRISVESGNREWQQIGYQPGSGNSNSSHTYSFTDKFPLSGSIRYRIKQVDNNGSFEYHYSTELTLLPVANALRQNYPNPFNPETRITYCITDESKVTLRIYNVLGKEVALFDRNIQAPGEYSLIFNAVQLGLSSGLYYYRIEAGRFNETKKMLLIK